MFFLIDYVTTTEHDNRSEKWCENLINALFMSAFLKQCQDNRTYCIFAGFNTRGCFAKKQINFAIFCVYKFDERWIWKQTWKRVIYKKKLTLLSRVCDTRKTADSIRSLKVYRSTVTQRSKKQMLITSRIFFIAFGKISNRPQIPISQRYI